MTSVRPHLPSCSQTVQSAAFVSHKNIHETEKVWLLIYQINMLVNYHSEQLRDPAELD